MMTDGSIRAAYGGARRRVKTSGRTPFLLTLIPCVLKIGRAFNRLLVDPLLHGTPTMTQRKQENRRIPHLALRKEIAQWANAEEAVKHHRRIVANGFSMLA